MGFRFRQRFTLFPGVRLNMSGSGLSVSLGVPGATINLKPGRSPRATLGIPGTGISYQTPIGSTPGRKPNNSASRPPALPDTPESVPDLVRNISSRSIDEITSASLVEVKEMIRSARQERAGLEQELAELRVEATRADARAKRLSYPLWHWLLKGAAERARANAAARAQDASEAAASLATHGVTLQWELDEQSQAAYDALRTAFENASAAIAIWDLVRDAKIDRAGTRSFASRSIERKHVAFGWGRPDILPAQENDRYAKIPRLGNANGGDLYFFPGFALMLAPQDFALLHPASVTVGVAAVRFQEDQAVPADSEVVGRTWQYVNKDGQPDRRFKNNPQFPVVQYATVTLTSSDGLNEEYMLSNAAAGAAFGQALQHWAAAVPKSSVNRKQPDH